MSLDSPFFELVEKIAVYLPNEWRFNYLIDEKEKYANPQIVGLKGAAINFRYRCDVKGMVSVTGTWPKIAGDSRYTCVRHWGVLKKNETYPTINFNVNRKPLAIARDIEKRFLAYYQDYYARCLIERAKTIQHRDNVQHKIEALKRVHPLVENVHKHNPDRPRLYLVNKLKNSLSGELFYNSNNKFDASFSNLPLDKMIKILAVLNDDIEQD